MGDLQYTSDQRGNTEFALAFEGSYQYMDLKPKGYQNHNAVNGSFYKLTFVPTLKANDINNFFSCPSFALFATWMDWSSKLDDFASNDAFGSSGFNTGGEEFCVQMETCRIRQLFDECEAFTEIMN